MKARVVAAAIFLLGCNGQSQTPLLPASSARQDGSSGQSFSYNVCTASGNRIVCNPSRVEFTEDIGQQLLAHMPDSKKTILLTTLGTSNADQTVGSQVQEYLIGRGRTVRRLSIGQMARTPDYPFTLQVSENQYELTVAPSAH